MPVYLFTFQANCDAQANCDTKMPHLLAVPAICSPTARRREAGMGAANDDAGFAFDSDHQRRLIDVAIDSQASLCVRFLGFAAGRNRVDVLVAWDDHRDASLLQTRLKDSLAFGLCSEFGRRGWFAEADKCKRVRNRTQYEYLRDHYLPKQIGTTWSTSSGFRTTSMPDRREVRMIA